ncbi:MAG: energy transducer TonB [Bacillati bacterium ANGP1]|uniref:Energy transducer TonB n=1 Tax=Candidatus Segetimicrobium genomatis TaxID=2569760 RepID=A0A537JLW4_9BACT|nr:MAG: energy transducer TonB [Terrabacteria group bacterium ANGP1]
MPPHIPRLVPPSVITQAGTEYPADAFRLTVRRQDLGTAFAFDGVEGTVGVRALVLADGTVARVDVSDSSGSAVLDRAAAEAVRRWRFLPATRDGVPIDAYVRRTRTSRRGRSAWCFGRTGSPRRSRRAGRRACAGRAARATRRSW